jgi:kynureninase
MNKEQAHDLLNKIKEGQTFDFDQITAALIAAGDIAGWREAHLVGSLEAGMRS